MTEPDKSQIDSQSPARDSSCASGAARTELSSTLDPGYRITIPTRRSPSVAQAVLLGSTFAQLAIALLITIYLARELSPAAFGFFSLVGTIFVLARKFLDLGLSNVAARETARNPARERPILEGMMAYQDRAAGIALAIALFIFAFVQKDETECWVLLGTGIILLFTEPAALDPVFPGTSSAKGCQRC